jgi:carbon-monoxide dehydrogenase medium subunit
VRGFEEYYAPRSLEEALAILSQRPGRVRLVAGGTDVMVRLRRTGTPDGENVLLNVKNIPELGVIEETGSGEVRIGAAVTARDLVFDDIVRSRIPLVARVANLMASPQIRAAATIGGNVANASPAADLAIPLLLLDAEVESAGFDSGRGAVENGATVLRETTPVESFFVGPGQTSLRTGWMITSIRLPAGDDTMVYSYRKGGVRPAMECAVTSVGLGVSFGADGTILGARVACGAVAPTPIRVHEAEAYLAGKTAGDETVEAAAAVVGEEIRPIDDVRGSAVYRTDLTKALFKTAFAECLDQFAPAGGGA